MRHQKKLKKIGLPKDHRTALLRNLIASLVIHERIRTTQARAKALSSRFDRVMSLVKRKDTREAIRTVAQYCTIEAASRKLVGELKGRYENRTSGFTRITRVGMRKGDNAKLVQIELL